jgi:hypothetical protein
MPRINYATRNYKLQVPIKKVDILPPIVQQKTNNNRSSDITQRQFGGGFRVPPLKPSNNKITHQPSKKCIGDDFRVESLETNRNETTKQKLKHSPSEPSPIPHKDKVSKFTGGGFKMK